MSIQNKTAKRERLPDCASLPHRGRCTGICTGLLLALCLGIPVTGATAPPDPRMLPQPSEDIGCDATPFGLRMTLGRDVEMLDLLDFNSLANPRTFHEWVLPEDPEPQSPPLESSIETDWTYYNENALAGSELLKAVRADLDGDGRDELVVATRVLGDDGIGNVKIGVYRREPFTTSIPITLIDTWESPMRLSQFDIAVGDLDGSADGKEELALLIRRSGAPPIQTSLTVFVLSGTTEGGIQQEDNDFAGIWNWALPPARIGQVDIAAGDMLLDGRAQMVVVAEGDPSSDGINRTLNYHLLEYQPQSDALPIVGGSSQIGSKSFSTLIGSNFDVGETSVGHTIGVLGITRIAADAADVAGDAAAELITHYEFDENEAFSLGQRVQHFRAIRDAENVITDIELATREAAGVDYDYSRLLRQDAGTRGDWDVVVSNVDAEAKDEIVVASNDTTQPQPRLRVDVYKAAFDLTADFTFHTSDRQVQFHETSVGIGPGPFDSPSGEFHSRWEFGDGETLNVVNPTHEYPQDDEDITYKAILRIQQHVGGSTVTSAREVDVTIDGGSNDGGGLDSSEYMFQLLRDPSYSAIYSFGNNRAFSPISVTAGDMDRDGRVEIMTLARMGTDSSPETGLLRSLWRVEYNPDSSSELVGTHLFTPNEPFQPNSDLRGLQAVAVDFDGDSIEATIGADCRHVEEAQVRDLIWTPPYFQRLQQGAQKSSSIGTSTLAGTGVESQFGTFTSHDFSGYIGLQLGSDAIGVAAAARATAGYFMQSAHGGLVGSENSRELSEARSQNSSDALVVVERNEFNCYTYDVSQSTIGVDPNSSVRFCEILDNQTALDGWDTNFWDREYPQPWAEGSEGHTPPEWAPLHRDWSNLALFRTATSNASFLSGAGPEHVTDGRYTTPTESQTMNQPYIEIDLGSVQPISGITVFPKHDELASDLIGFRLFTSTAPMPATGLPGGPDVHVFAPESIDDAVYDRWNIWTRQWNPDDPTGEVGDMLRVRYIRLQHPGQARLSLGQIQVFGDAHAEPPQYPDAVCDPVAHDGLFLAKVWDAVHGNFRAIEIRGDMLWTGTGPDDEDNDKEIHEPSWLAEDPYLEQCTNHVVLNRPSDHNFEIFAQVAVGGSTTHAWNLHTDSRNSVGDTTSFERSTRVGAEFDLTVGAFASMVSGGAYEVATGVTEDHQNVSYWGVGLDLGGEISGFQPPYDGNDYVLNCSYNARPYAYARTERSNTGYEHAIYAVDYVVPEGTGATAWHRADFPQQCLPDQAPGDRIFQSGFELP